MAPILELKGREAVLEILKRDGPISADSAAEKLGLTAMAVRQHLYRLEAAGEAAHALEARPRGRPVKLWRATPAADAHFADGHSALASDLILQMKRAFGDEGLDKLLKLRNADLEKNYRTKTDKVETLKAKLEALAKLRSAEGYMAAVEAQDDGSFLLIENHCPICAVARACSGLSDSLRLSTRIEGSAQSRHSMNGSGTLRTRNR